MKTLNQCLVLFILIVCSSCDSEKYELIDGTWQCGSWIVERTGSDNCRNNVSFTFNADKTYTSKIGGQVENGVYRISNGLLYSTPKDKLEIGVELNTLNSDTLQFTMSRSGDKEVMTLLKKK